MWIFTKMSEWISNYMKNTQINALKHSIRIETERLKELKAKDVTTLSWTQKTALKHLWISLRENEVKLRQLLSTVNGWWVILNTRILLQSYIIKEFYKDLKILQKRGLSQGEKELFQTFSIINENKKRLFSLSWSNIQKEKQIDNHFLAKMISNLPTMVNDQFTNRELFAIFQRLFKYYKTYFEYTNFEWDKILMNMVTDIEKWYSSNHLYLENWLTDVEKRNSIEIFDFLYNINMNK